MVATIAPTTIRCVENMMKSTKRTKLMENTKLILQYTKKLYTYAEHNLNRYKQASASSKFNFIVCTNSIRFRRNPFAKFICIHSECFSTVEFVYGNNEFTFINWPKLELLPFNLSN